MLGSEDAHPDPGAVGRPGTPSLPPTHAGRTHHETTLTDTRRHTHARSAKDTSWTQNQTPVPRYTQINTHAPTQHTRVQSLAPSLELRSQGHKSRHMITHNTQVCATPQLHSMTNIPRDVHRLTHSQAWSRGQHSQIHLHPAPARHAAFMLPWSVAWRTWREQEHGRWRAAQATGAEGSGSALDCAVRCARWVSGTASRCPRRSGRDSCAGSSSKHTSGHEGWR